MKSILLKSFGGKTSIPATDYNLKIEEDDRLVFGGVLGMISEVQKIKGPDTGDGPAFSNRYPTAGSLLCGSRGLQLQPVHRTEALWEPTSGSFMMRWWWPYPGAASKSGSLGNVVLEEGDTLLLETNPKFL